MVVFIEEFLFVIKINWKSQNEFILSDNVQLVDQLIDQILFV